MSDFNAAVLDWLTSNIDTHAVSVTKVNGSGTDWAGDTDAGFYEKFEVDITYETSGGSRSRTVGGEDLRSLWDHVVTRWPS